METENIRRINISSEIIEEQIEIVVQLYLEHLYVFALLANNEQHIADCAAFLALAERIIKTYSENSRDPRTIQQAQKVLLFISSLLIADNDFETAKTYQANCLKLSFRELFLRVDIDSGVCYANLSKTAQHYLNKIFVNIVIAFYHRGVSEENLGNIVKAIEAYKQSKWFAMKFIKEEVPELAQFIFDVEKRALSYHQLINTMKAKDDELKRSNNNNEKEKLKNETKDNNLAKLAEGNYIDLSRHDKTKKFIESLDIPELEFKRQPLC